VGGSEGRSLPTLILLVILLAIWNTVQGPTRGILARAHNTQQPPSCSTTTVISVVGCITWVFSRDFVHKWSKSKVHNMYYLLLNRRCAIKCFLCVVSMQGLMNMIFEVQDLAVASPATVSRCGMVYVQPDLLG